MDALAEFHRRALKAYQAALAKAEKDVALFKSLHTSARKAGADDFGFRTLLSHAYERVRILEDGIDDLKQRMK
jgi:hypothetical protein